MSGRAMCIKPHGANGPTRVRDIARAGVTSLTGVILKSSSLPVRLESGRLSAKTSVTSDATFSSACHSSLSITSLETALSPSYNTTSNFLVKRSSRDTSAIFLPPLVIGVSVACIFVVIWLVYREFHKRRSASQPRDTILPITTVTTVSSLNPPRRISHNIQSRHAQARHTQALQTRYHRTGEGFNVAKQDTLRNAAAELLTEQQLEMSSQVSVDGSALEREESIINKTPSNKDIQRLSLRSVYLLSDATTTANNKNNQRINPSQHDDTVEVTRILVEQMEAIQRLEVEIRQMKAEGHAISYIQNHGSSLEYRSSIDPTSQADDAPPSYGEIDSRP